MDLMIGDRRFEATIIWENQSGQKYNNHVNCKRTDGYQLYELKSLNPNYIPLKSHYYFVVLNMHSRIKICI